jgi:P4 family phage/plasmid primase-like protien
VHIIYQRSQKRFKKLFTFQTFEQIFDPTLLENVPNAQKTDIHGTIYDTTGERKGFVIQTHIPIDIDQVHDPVHIPLVLEKTALVFGIPSKHWTVVWSGRGIHLYVKLAQPITTTSFFEAQRAYYNNFAKTLEASLTPLVEGISVDTNVFAKNQLMRMPYSLNSKAQPEHNQAYVHQMGSGEGIQFFTATNQVQGRSAESSNPPTTMEQPTTLSRSMLKKMKLIKVDDKAVEEGCGFLQYCKANQDKLDEPTWYAMLSLVGRFEDKNKIHEYSKNHPDYSHGDCEAKREQALNASGPRLCESIARDFAPDICLNCPHFETEIVTPLQIKAEDFIATEETGFHDVIVDKKGKTTYKLNIHDLYLAFKRDNPYLWVPERQEMYTYKDNYWSPLHIDFSKDYCEEKVRPYPKNAQVQEFLGKLKRKHLFSLVDIREIEERPLINLNNGLFDFKTKERYPHDKDHHQFHKLPFDYAPTAQCPRYDQFLDEVCESDPHKIRILWEFLAVTIARIPSNVTQKALLLVGDGSNGKSVYLHIVKKLIGKEFYAALPMKRESYREFSLDQLYGKFANVSEEADELAHNLLGGDFKNIISGGDVLASKKGQDPYFFVPNAKYFIACNSIPRTMDTSSAVSRRLLVVNFNRKFYGKDKDPNLHKKLEAELSGIFNKCLFYLEEFNARGGFLEAGSIKLAAERYKKDSNSLANFMESCIQKVDQDNPDYYYVYSMTDLYEKYIEFCEIMGIRPLERIKLSRHIKDNFEVKPFLCKVKKYTVKGIRGFTIDFDNID